MYGNTHVYQMMFVDTDEIGSHSKCKCVARFCCTRGYPETPIELICLHVWWTIGRVNKKDPNVKMLVLNLLVEP